jgi:hypothetical protein
VSPFGDYLPKEKKRKEKTVVYLYKIYPVHCFFRNFCLYPKWLSSIGRCKKGGGHPYEDLAKSGDISEIKYKCLTILLYFWLHDSNEMYGSGDLHFFSFWQLKIVSFLNLGKILPVKTILRCPLCVPTTTSMHDRSCTWY